VSSAALREVVCDVHSWNPQREARGEYINYIDLSSIDNEAKIINSHQRVLADEAPSRARQLVRTGDILLSTVRPYLNGVARVPQSLDGATASTGFCVLRANAKKISPEYLFQWLKSPQFIADMTRKATGASYPAVSDRIVFDSEFPLRPLDEQRRIAAILDQADALRRKRHQSLISIGRLHRVVFIELFGTVRESREQRIPLGKIATFTGGGTPSRTRPDYYKGGICWASSKDMTSERIHDTQEHITDEAVAGSATNLVPPGTVLVVVKSKILMRRLPVAITDVRLCFNQDIKAISVRPPYSPDFIMVSLLVDQDWLLRMARGANTEGLTLDHLKMFPVAAASEGKIRKFDRLTASINTQARCMEASLAKLNALFLSLQKAAFDERASQSNFEIASTERAAAE